MVRGEVRSTPLAPGSGGARPSLRLSRRASRLQRLGSAAGQGLLFLVTTSSMLAVIFIFAFIVQGALPFFRLRGFGEFLLSTHWYPSADPPEFGGLAIFFGSGLVTLGASVVAVPLGVMTAVCLSDILPFGLRQVVKPVIEILAAIPSVAFGFFALVVLAPALQRQGGPMLHAALWLVAGPPIAIAALVAGDLITGGIPGSLRRPLRLAATLALAAAGFGGLALAGHQVGALSVASGTNALNVSIILGIMALPTVISVSEDALQAVGRELREGSYALGATRAETLLRVVLPAAASGIGAAVILGVMRALGETMVVWMASGNAATIPEPWFDFLEPVRTLTATIAGDMGEADHVTGSARYHVLFAMALCLLLISLLANLATEWIVQRAKRKIAA